MSRSVRNFLENGFPLFDVDKASQPFVGKFFASNGDYTIEESAQHVEIRVQNGVDVNVYFPALGKYTGKVYVVRPAFNGATGSITLKFADRFNKVGNNPRYFDFVIPADVPYVPTIAVMYTRYGWTPVNSFVLLYPITLTMSAISQQVSELEQRLDQLDGISAQLSAISQKVSELEQRLDQLEDGI